MPHSNLALPKQRHRNRSQNRACQCVDFRGGGRPRNLGASRRRTKSRGSQARHLRKIATEEAFTIPEVASALRDVVRAGGRNLDLPLLAAIYDAPAGTQPRFLQELLDLDAQRLADMDRHNVQMHLLALTAPGVQMFDAEMATSLARVATRVVGCSARTPTE